MSVAQVQPRLTSEGLCCPKHDRPVYLRTIRPGILVCELCRLVYTQREMGLTFVVAREKVAL
jgi:hypothetical protein